MQIHWIWFAGLNKISAAQKIALLERFSDPEEIFALGAAALKQTDGVTGQMLQEMNAKDLSAAEKIVKICADKGIDIVTFADKAYPARLRNIYDPPMVLYCKGTLPNTEAAPVIGVVGTRKATAYGLSVARDMSRQIAACGGIVVSGGAGGIDTLALQGALEMEKSVVAVLGCGVDICYPKENKRLFDRIPEKGCLISEYAPGTRPYSWNFPRRNRIISGMSNGVLVVEAPEKSGALITAREALEQGRDVFVVPGNINVAACAGSNALLQGYAMAAFTGWDILQEYQQMYPGAVQKREVPAHIREAEYTPAKVAQQPAKPQQEANPVSAKPIELTAEEEMVAKCLTQEPRQVDEIIARLKLPAAKVMSILTMLTVKGVVCSHPGKRVSKICGGK
jgi:DNA processing protein